MKGSGGIDDIDLSLRNKMNIVLQKSVSIDPDVSYLECALCSGAWDICVKLAEVG